MRPLSFLAVLVVGLAQCSPADIGYENLFKSSPLPVEWQCWNHTLPHWLNGSLLLPSVGLFEFKGKEFQGLLDGYGKLHRFQFDGPNSELCMHSKMMLSNFYNMSIAKGTVVPSVLSRETSPPRSCGLDPFCNVQGPNDNVFVNTIRLGDVFLQLTDTPTALQMDLRSLDILGKWNWTDGIGHKAHLGVLGSAHPLRRPGPDGEWIVIQTDVPLLGDLGGTYVNIAALSDQKPTERRLIASVHTPFTPYFHSYGVTENYAVLPFTPMAYSMAATLEGKPMINSFKQAKQNRSVFHIVPLDGGKTIEIESPTAFTYDHVVNAYENGTTIIFDACIYKDAKLWLVDGQTDIKTQVDKTLRDALKYRQTVVRFTIDLDQATVNTRDLSDPNTMTDFPKINPAFSGLPYCVYYANDWFHNKLELGSMAVVKENICTNERTSWYRPGWYPSEPYLIDSPEDDAEESGLLAFSALDGANNQSWMILVSPSTMETVMEQRLPHMIPFTTHAQYYDIMGK